MLKKMMILTVGTGTRPDVDIVKPLLKSIRDSAPKFIGFVATSESEKFTREIIRELNLPPENYDILILPDSENLESIYSNINHWMRNLMQSHNYSPQEITIDFTSGTKAMTCGVVLAGVAWGCANLKYISGKRRNGVVQNGTERFITVQPNTILAHKQIEIGKNLLNEFRFESAMSVFNDVNRALLEDWEIRLLDGYINIAYAYDCWDRFMQNRVDGYLSKVPDEMKEFDNYRVSKNIRQRLIDIYKAQEKEEVTEDMLGDLYNNARRRFIEGKFDDATARLYRLVEMAAQMVLWKDYQIKTGDVPEDKIQFHLKRSFEENRDPTDGRIKIGLKKSYELLKELKNPLGDKYFQNKKIKGLLKQRNDSFLAHGTKPISKEACQSLFDETRDLVKSFIPKFDRIIEELRFPWQSIKEK